MGVEQAKSEAEEFRRPRFEEQCVREQHQAEREQWQRKASAMALEFEALRTASTTKLHEEVETWKAFHQYSQQQASEAWRRLDDVETVVMQEQSEAEELSQARLLDQKKLEEYQVERHLWQEEISAIAAEFEDLRAMAGN